MSATLYSACDRQPKTLVVPINATIYSQSDNITFRGTHFEVSGFDHNPHGNRIKHGTLVYGVATPYEPASIGTRLDGRQKDNVNGEGGYPSIVQVSRVDIPMLMDQLSSRTDRLVSPGSYSDSTWGDLDALQITRVTGNLDAYDHISGRGILLVDGRLRIDGNFSWYGIVITAGDFMVENTGYTKLLYGAVFSSGSTNQIAGNMDLHFASSFVAEINELLLGSGVQFEVMAQ